MNDSIGSFTVSRGPDELARRRLSRDERRRAEAQAAAERRINEQLRMVSHELRNSLVALRIGLHMLETKSREPASVAEGRTLIDGQVVQISRLIDDLLELSTRAAARK